MAAAEGKEPDVLYLGRGGKVGCLDRIHIRAKMKKKGWPEPDDRWLDRPPGKFPGERVADADRYSELSASDPRWRKSLSLDAPTEVELEGVVFDTPRSALVYRLFQQALVVLREKDSPTEAVSDRIERDTIARLRAAGERHYLAATDAPKSSAERVAMAQTEILSELAKRSRGAKPEPLIAQATFGRLAEDGYWETATERVMFCEPARHWWAQPIFAAPAGERTIFGHLMSEIRELQFGDNPRLRKLLLATGTSQLVREVPGVFGHERKTARDVELETLRERLLVESQSERESGAFGGRDTAAGGAGGE